VLSGSLWILGSSRSGKTTRLVEQFDNWIRSESDRPELFYTINAQRGNHLAQPQISPLKQPHPSVLVLAANNDNRQVLADTIVTSVGGKYPVRCKTPLGFLQDEVTLFWPLLIQSLNLKAQFPLRLRPETEQELATKLWRSSLDEEILRLLGVREYRAVRRILDLFQLAAYSGCRCEDIGEFSAQCFQDISENLEPEFFVSLLLNWRNWCLERGLLSYGIITELWKIHLLPNPNYQQHLAKRYQAVLADDVQDYPAIARDLFEFFLDRGGLGAFSFNPDSAVRLGLGADPDYIEGIAGRCQVESLNQQPQISLASLLAATMQELVIEPMALMSLPNTVRLIQSTSRAELLQKTAEYIAEAIKEKRVEPDEVAIIAPGLDAIARYTLMNTLQKEGIAVECLNDQRPLITSPVVRALLTVLALVYPGLGRLVDRDAVAEMLVVLSTRSGELGIGSGESGIGSGGSSQRSSPSPSSSPSSPTPHSPSPTPHIDPVRAGLIADYCFVPHPEQPNLLPVTAFDRWDRLGYEATTAYEKILAWIEQQREQQELYLIASPILVLDRAIQTFLWNGSNLPYDQLAALRELLETAQHFWEVDTRVKQANLVTKGQEVISSEGLASASKTHWNQSTDTIAEFIQLLRRGTITANPYPVRSVGVSAKYVTLATIFQYRSNRKSHRWHFWLDAGSPLWAKGGAATLFGAPYFLKHRLGQLWTADDEKSAENIRLETILTDLLSRVSHRVYLCHSDLAVNGQEQLGPLLPLVHACMAMESDSVVS
jgi:hypothetical protein